MHYANGQEAKAGDLVYLPIKPNQKWAQREAIGILTQANAGSTSYNGQMQPVVVRSHSDAGVGPWRVPESAGEYCITVGEIYPADPAVFAMAIGGNISSKDQVG